MEGRSKSTKHICFQDADQVISCRDHEANICIFSLLLKQSIIVHTFSLFFFNFLFNSSFHWVSSIWYGESGALCCHKGLADRREWGFSTPTTMGCTPQEGRGKLHSIPWGPDPLSLEGGTQQPCSVPRHLWGSFFMASVALTLYKRKKKKFQYSYHSQCPARGKPNSSG